MSNNFDYETFFSQSAEDISNCIIVLPEITDINIFKFRLGQYMLQKGKTGLILPSFTTLFEIAREITGTQTGEMIRFVDFNYLLNQYPDQDIPKKFISKHSKSYKLHLFQFINEVSMISGEFNGIVIEQPLLTRQLSRIGLTEKIYDKITTFIREKGFMLKGDILKKALEIANNRHTFYNGQSINNIRFYITSFRYYAGFETELIRLLDPVVMENPSDQDISSGFENIITRSIPLEKIMFFKASSYRDQLMKIKHSIDSEISKNPAFQFSDFSVICGSTSSAEKAAAYFHASRIPFYSGISYNQPGTIAIMLQTFLAAAENDPEKITDFFNKYFVVDPDEIINLDLHSSADFYSIIQLYNDLRSSSETIIEKFLKKTELKKKYLKFLEILSSGFTDKVDSFQNHLKLLNDKINVLSELISGTMLQKSLDPYYNVLSKIFTSKIKLKDIIDYLLEIIPDTISMKSGNDTAGIHLVTLDDSISMAGKISYFIDLEEGNFLSRKNKNKLLTNESYEFFDKLLYGRSIEDHYLERLSAFISSKTEKLFFILPAYNEETIISSYIEELLAVFPKQQKEVFLLSKSGKQNLGQYDFTFTSSNLLNADHKKKYITVLPVYIQTKKGSDHELKIIYKGSNILSELRSATKIEAFNKCPALFVHKLNCEYPIIETDDTFRPGKKFHTIAENFINKYKGKDLLNEENYINAFKNLTGRNESLSESKLNEFVHAIVEDQSKASGISPELTGLLNKSGLITDIENYLADEANRDKSRETTLIRTKIQLLIFMVKFIHYLGITDETITSGFNTEVAFDDLPLNLKGPYHSVKGVIDFLYVTKDNSVRIIDFKSGELKDYEELMEKFQISQLLLYKHLIETSKKDPANFRFFDIQNTAAFGRDVTKLDQIFFKKILDSKPEIEACYLSYKEKFLQEVDEDFNDFLNEFNRRLGDHKTFHPEANNNCRFCQLSQGCHENIDVSIDLSPFEKFFKLSDRAFPVAEIQKTFNIDHNDQVIDEDTAAHNLIQFEGDKATALIEDQKHIIISAGAGAGKTEVLAHKYLSLIINRQLSPDQILCITFTNKAVGEMKKRIFSRLTETIDTGIFAAIPGADGDYIKLDPNAVERLIKLRKTFHTKNRILTFHAFCNDLFEEHAKSDAAFTDHDLEYRIAPSYIINEEIRKYIKEQYIREFSSAFSSGKNLLVKESDIFKQWHRSIRFYYSADFGEGGFVKELQSIIDKIRLSGKTFDELINMNYDEFLVLFNEIKGLSNLRNEYLTQKLELQNCIELIVLNETDNSKKLKFEEALHLVKNDLPHSFGQTFRNHLEVRDLRDLIKENSYFKFISKRSEKGFAEDDFLDIEYAIRKAVLMVANDVNNHISKFKRENGYIEQSDLHQMAIRLLESNPDLPAETDTKYLLIDEFQDTNWLQEKIIGHYIKKGTRLFIVGDMKQSIYRFQQCDNQIFKKFSLMSLSYPKEYLYLNFNENYRSVPELVNFSNHYFSNATNNPQFDIFSLTSRDPDQPELMLPAKKSEKNQPLISFIEIGYNKEEFEELPESDLKQIVQIKEADLIAQTILENDPELTNLNNWGILIRKYSRIGYLIEFFKKYHIPYSFIMKSGLLDQPEVIDLILILKVLANQIKKEDIPYIDDIGNLINDINSDEICQKSILHAIEKVITHPVLHAHLKKDANYHEKKANLDIIYNEICNSFDFTGTNLLNLIKHIENSGSSLGMEFYNNNSVRIMTIHSSKGLEFENVILANLNAFDRNDSEQISFLNKVIDADHRITDISVSGIKNLYTDKYDPEFLKHMLFSKEFNKEFQQVENANLLYVALTRAKKNIFVTIQRNNIATASSGSSNNWMQNIDQQLFAGVIPEDGFGTVNTRFLNEVPVFLSRVNISEIHPYKFIDQKEESSLYIKVEKTTEKLLTKNPEHQFFSVTGLSEDDNFSGQLSRLGSEEAIITGTFVHKFMQLHIPEIFEQLNEFEKIFESFCKNYSYPVSDETRKNAAEMLIMALKDPQFIHLFQNADQIFREQEFIFERSSGKDLFTQENIFVDGAIDLLIIKKNKAIIVDYKTGEWQDHYKKQVSLYAEAVKISFPGIKFTEKYIFRINKEEKECGLIEVRE